MQAPTQTAMPAARVASLIGASAGGCIMQSLGGAK